MIFRFYCVFIALDLLVVIYLLIALIVFQLRWTQFEGLLTTLIGYLIISISLVILHFVASFFRFRR